MPEFYSNAANEHGRGLDEFTRGYIMALYFTDSGDWDEEKTDEENSDNGNSFDTEDELSADSLARIIADCTSFQASFADDLAQYREATGRSLEHAGHDFWLTRNGHGAGFWDRGDDACLDRLTDASKAYGPADCYRGDDGMVYIC